jgi:hypothetical protein
MQFANRAGVFNVALMVATKPQFTTYASRHTNTLYWLDMRKPRAHVFGMRSARLQRRKLQTFSFY